MQFVNFTTKGLRVIQRNLLCHKCEVQVARIYGLLSINATVSVTLTASSFWIGYGLIVHFLLKEREMYYMYEMHEVKSPDRHKSFFL